MAPDPVPPVRAAGPAPAPAGDSTSAPPAGPAPPAAAGPAPPAAVGPAPAAPAGYPGTPLPRKLGIKSGHTIALISAPPGFADSLEPLPGPVTVQDSLDGDVPFDVIVFFAVWRAELAAQLDSLRARMAPACGLWIAWPKRAARVPTDMTEHVVREISLPTGLVDNKVCAIDETWSALRLVIRRANR